MLARLTSISMALIAMFGGDSAVNDYCPLAERTCCTNIQNVTCGFAAVEPC